jgi:two-component system nitrogen regulation sensor histidine kinase GlnL
VLDELDTAILELNDRNRIERMNEAAERCFGTGKDRSIGLDLARIGGVPTDLNQAVTDTRSDQRRRHLRECHLAGGMYDCNIQLLENQHVLLELYNLRWEQQRQQLEQREVQTGMLELLRRNLGHEIRNPLGGIRGAAQMMAAELGEQELGTLARLIMREVDRIDELIQRFGQPRISRGKLDIHKVTDESIELLMAESGGETLVSRDFDPSIPQLDGDASALRQILLNLVLNAYQAGARNILLRTRIEHGFALMQSDNATTVRVDVEDDGEGVPEHLRALLFLPLVTGRREGTGLGLALAQQMAAAHGGLLFFEALDKGSRFSLRLPLPPDEQEVADD